MGSTKSTRRIYNYIEEKAEGNLYTVSTKSQLAECIGVSLRTVTNALNELEAENKLVVASKRGRNGGVVITLIKEDFDREELQEFKDSDDSIVTSTKKYAENLRDKYFPSYTYQRKEERRRTKLEMVAYNAVKEEKRRTHMDMNFKSSQMPYPSREVFDMAPDPEGYFRAYLLCHLYDQYSVTHMERRANYFETKAVREYQEERYDMAEWNTKFKEFYQEQIPIKLSSTTMHKDFFGSKEFNTFYNFYKKVGENGEFNIFRYMINVFRVHSFKYEKGLAKSVVPPINFFSSDKHIQDYRNYLQGIKVNINNTQRHLGETEHVVDVSDYNGNPLILQLQQLYQYGYEGNLHNIDEMFEHAMDVEDYKLGIYHNKKHLTLLDFNARIENKIAELPNTERTLIDKFVKQLTINEYSPSSFSSVARTAMFPMQKGHIVNTLKLDNQNLAEYLLEIGLAKFNISDIELEPIDIATIKESALNFIVLSKYNHTYYVMRMFSDYLGYEVNIKDVKHIIETYNLEDIIPLTQNGMLDYSKFDGLDESDE